MESFLEEGTISKTVKIKDFCKACKLELLAGNPEDDITFTSTLVNRPGLILAGFDDYFGSDRVQIIGYAEHFYYYTLTDEEKKTCMHRMCSKHIPCLVTARAIVPNKITMDVAKQYNVPMFMSKYTTTSLNGIIADYLESLLAPSISYHGTLLDISGTGVLLTGESGMGKSETALELIHRGHRLIADDAVIIKRVNNELVGSAPENIKFFMEVRGIGIIDVRSMYGVSAVLTDDDIHLIINLTNWTEECESDRLGNKEQRENILGLDIPKLTIPVRPGRNIAVLVEVAAKNFRLKKFGYDPLEELKKRAHLKE